jgi:hypothetical protein
LEGKGMEIVEQTRKLETLEREAEISVAVAKGKDEEIAERDAEIIKQSRKLETLKREARTAKTALEGKEKDVSKQSKRLETLEREAKTAEIAMEGKDRNIQGKDDEISEQRRNIGTFQEEAKTAAGVLEGKDGLILERDQKISEQVQRLRALQREAWAADTALKGEKAAIRAMEREASEQAEKIDALQEELKATADVLKGKDKVILDADQNFSRQELRLGNLNREARVNAAVLEREQDRAGKRDQTISEQAERVGDLGKISDSTAKALELKSGKAEALGEKVTKQTNELKQILMTALVLQEALKDEQDGWEEEREGWLRAATDHETEKQALLRQIELLTEDNRSSERAREQAARRVNRLRLIDVPAQKTEILSLKRKLAEETEEGSKRIRETEDTGKTRLKELWTALGPEDLGILEDEESRISDSDLELLVACSDWLDGVAIRCEANRWLHNLRGLASASATGFSGRGHALRLFEKGTKDRSDVSLDDIVEMVEGLAGAPSLVKVLCPIWAYIRYQGKRVKEWGIDTAKAVILLRSIELVYLHVRHSHRLRPLREEFLGMRSCLEKPAERSALVALLLEWLTQAMESSDEWTLASHITARAQFSSSIDMSGVKIVSCGTCVVVVCEMRVYFRWPENFRLLVEAGLHLVVDDLPEPGRQWKAPWDYTEEGMKKLALLLGNAQQRILNAQPAAPRRVLMES